MSINTKIEWTDASWNPVTGCTKVSRGCRWCYAERVVERFYPQRKFTDVRCHPERLEQPLRWHKRRRIFVNSMSDLFHEDVPDSFIGRVFGVMAVCQQHTFQVLTKRPIRARDLLADGVVGPVKGEADQTAFECFRGHRPKNLPPLRAQDWPGLHWPLRNVWLGVSVEDQDTADERIPLLLETPAATRFVSYEPALEGVDFNRWLWKPARKDSGVRELVKTERLHWIIVGGESGAHARPFDLNWARAVIAQCREANVPCFVKQLGAKAGTLLRAYDGTWEGFPTRDRKGGDPSEWPQDLRVREYPG